MPGGREKKTGDRPYVKGGGKRGSTPKVSSVEEVTKYVQAYLKDHPPVATPVAKKKSPPPVLPSVSNLLAWGKKAGYEMSQTDIAKGIRILKEKGLWPKK